MLRVINVEEWLSRPRDSLCTRLILAAPGTRGIPHFHPGRETAIYLVSGAAEVWHGASLGRRSAIRAGDFLCLPPGAPHLVVNRGDVTAIAVVARSDETEADAAVAVEMPRHLADLSRLPVTAPH